MKHGKIWFYTRMSNTQWKSISNYRLQVIFFDIAQSFVVWSYRNGLSMQNWSLTDLWTQMTLNCHFCRAPIKKLISLCRSSNQLSGYCCLLYLKDFPLFLVLRLKDSLIIHAYLLPHNMIMWPEMLVLLIHFCGLLNSSDTS